MSLEKDYINGKNISESDINLLINTNSFFYKNNGGISWRKGRATESFKKWLREKNLNRLITYIETKEKEYFD